MSYLTTHSFTIEVSMLSGLEWKEPHIWIKKLMLKDERIWFNYWPILTHIAYIIFDFEAPIQIISVQYCWYFQFTENMSNIAILSHKWSADNNTNFNILNLERWVSVLAAVGQFIWLHNLIIENIKFKEYIQPVKGGNRKDPTKSVWDPLNIHGIHIH